MKNLKISEEVLKNIHNDLLGNNALTCMFAIRKCVLDKIDDDKTVKIIQDLKSSPLIEWNSCKISNCALAGLHLLGIENYTGNDEQVLEMIDTVFYKK